MARPILLLPFEDMCRGILDLLPRPLIILNCQRLVNKLVIEYGNNVLAAFDSKTLENCDYEMFLARYCGRQGSSVTRRWGCHYNSSQPEHPHIPLHTIQGMRLGCRTFEEYLLLVHRFVSPNQNMCLTEEEARS